MPQSRYIFLLYLTAVLLLGCTRSPEAIFIAVFDEHPKSLVLIEGQDQYILDCCLWLHFKIEREDLEQILSKGFTSDEVDYTQWNSVSPQLDWWTQKYSIKQVDILKEF